jgi:erythromycin esterase-like protein
MEIMAVPNAEESSWEDVLHRSGQSNKLLILSEAGDTNAFMAEWGHRAIGVVYNPLTERYGNYVPTILPRRYDAFLYLDYSQALHPLHIKPQAGAEPPETYPWAI